MKSFTDAPFLKEMVDTLTNMYRLGWDERNGGNVSMMLTEEEITPYINTNEVKRTIPMGFKTEDILIGKYFLVTGTGKYFKNVKGNPAGNLGLIRVAADGETAELMWGYEDGGQFTSELPAHLMSHQTRLAIDPEHRVVMHCHPTNTLAMTHIHPLNDKEFTHTIWETCTECIVVFPEGIGVLPWMVCGTNEIGEATAEKMKDYRLVVWGLHGIYGVGKDLDETFGLIETVEKGAQLYMLYCHMPHLNTISDEELDATAKRFNLTYRTDFLNLK